MRQALLEAFESRKSEFSDLYGCSEWPVLKRGNKQPLIYIPFSQNQAQGTLVEFGTEKVLSNSATSLPYKSFMVAVVRRNQALAEQQLNWSYENGLEDYCFYQNFIDHWLQRVVPELIEVQRTGVKKNLEAHYASVAIVDPRFSARGSMEKIDLLVMSKEKLSEKINHSTGLESWDDHVTEYIDSWDEKRQGWLTSFSNNKNRGLEGDLIRKMFRGLPEVEVSGQTRKMANTAVQELEQRLSSFSLLQGCTNKEDYLDSLRTLLQLVETLSSENQFKSMESKDITARKYINRIKKIIEQETWESASSVIAAVEASNGINTILALQKLDLKVALSVNEVLEIWQYYYRSNYQRVVNENKESGADKKLEIEEKLRELLSDLEATLKSV